MSRRRMKWTLLGCLVVYLLLTIDSMFGAEAIERAGRGALYIVIPGLTAWLMLTWIFPKLIRTPQNQIRTKD